MSNHTKAPEIVAAEAKAARNDEIVRRYVAGQSMREIGAAVGGVSAQTILNVVRKRGVAVRRAGGANNVPRGRYFVQLAVSGNVASVLYALAADGTVWRLDDATSATVAWSDSDSWVQLPSAPAADPKVPA